VATQKPKSMVASLGKVNQNLTGSSRAAVGVCSLRRYYTRRINHASSDYASLDIRIIHRSIVFVMLTTRPDPPTPNWKILTVL